MPTKSYQKYGRNGRNGRTDAFLGSGLGQANIVWLGAMAFEEGKGN
tara:strand:+ start:1196 stop:1333 length:138 start_codon:yes stop_codon:yes gene_type:complete